MNFYQIKIAFYFFLMLVFLIMAFTTNDKSNVQFFSSLGIIMGALAIKFLNENSKLEN